MPRGADGERPTRAPWELSDSELIAYTWLAHVDAREPVPKCHEGALYVRTLADGRFISVQPMGWSKTYLHLSPAAVAPWYERSFCYSHRHRCILAAMLWDGDSDPMVGWERDFMTGRRRKGGDPNKETQRW